MAVARASGAHVLGPGAGDSGGAFHVEPPPPALDVGASLLRENKMASPPHGGDSWPRAGEHVEVPPRPSFPRPHLPGLRLPCRRLSGERERTTGPTCVSTTVCGRPSLPHKGHLHRPTRTPGRSGQPRRGHRLPWDFPGQLHGAPKPGAREETGWSGFCTPRPRVSASSEGAPGRVPGRRGLRRRSPGRWLTVLLL